MMIDDLTDDALLSATRGLVHRSLVVTAELLVHLGEIDARKLYLGRAFSSMFAFCVAELGFSEDVACNRIAVARLARDLPEVLTALRSASVHLAGLRILAPHFTEDNVGTLLAEATGKSKRQIEEIAARLSPKPPVASMVRKVAERAGPVPVVPLPMVVAPIASAPILLVHAPRPRSVVKPLAEELFKVQFTAKRPLREKLKEAQDLLRHSVPSGDLAEIIERGLDLLIADVKKQRFAVGRKPRAATASRSASTPATRHIPDAIKRTVYERDGGQCTYFATDGRRCAEMGGLEFDHADGFARTGTHSVDGIRLRCRAHNQYAAGEMYGDAFMEEARRRADVPKVARPGATSETKASTQRGTQPLLL
jgi:5-methylcytosine-specific restriction endonuclease McrA